MSINPYTPTTFSSPIVNPSVGGSGTPYPYVSPSEFQFAPTAVDTLNLVPGGTAQDQTQSLSDTLGRASAWADRFLFGADPASKGASLCATLSIETVRTKVLNGELRLICSYRPIIQVNGVDIGASMSSLSTIGSAAAAATRIGMRTIYVPMIGIPVRSGDTGTPNPIQSLGGHYTAVWSYVNGYPHTELASDITSGTSSCTLLPTDGGTGLLGVIPGFTQFTIVDGANTEQFTVATVNGTTVTSSAPFQFSHTLPTAPDFIPVTTLPKDVSLAVIYLATAIIKTQGDSGLVLAELTEPKSVSKFSGDEFSDVAIAMRLLQPYRIHTKQKV